MRIANTPGLFGACKTCQTCFLTAFNFTVHEVQRHQGLYLQGMDIPSFALPLDRLDPSSRQEANPWKGVSTEQSLYAAKHGYIVLTQAQAGPTNEEPVQGTHDVFWKQPLREHSNTDAPFSSE